MIYSDCILVFHGVINRNWNRFMILVGGGIEFCLYGMFCAPLEKILKLEIFRDMIYSIVGNIWVTLFCSKLMIDSVKKYLFSVIDHNSQSGWWNMVWQPATSFWLQPCLFKNSLISYQWYSLMSRQFTHAIFKTILCHHVMLQIWWLLVWCDVKYDINVVMSHQFRDMLCIDVTSLVKMSCLLWQVMLISVMSCYVTSYHKMSYHTHPMSRCAHLWYGST